MKKHIIINVGRQLGSGGRIIGNRIAEDFNIKFYDKELLDLAAKESGLNKEVLERNDEHKGFLKVLFSSFSLHFSFLFLPSSPLATLPPTSSVTNRFSNFNATPSARRPNRILACS